MNDLTLSAGMAQAFPSLYEGLRKAQSILDSIQSFEDIERVFLLGAGLSPNTYRSYLQAVRQFYHFTEGKHPLQVRPGDIEAFYDDLVQRVDRNTAYLRIRGLKKFFEGIRNVLPIYTCPFEVMTQKLPEKLNRTQEGQPHEEGADHRRAARAPGLARGGPDSARPRGSRDCVHTGDVGVARLGALQPALAGPGSGRRHLDGTVHREGRALRGAGTLRSRGGGLPRVLPRGLPSGSPARGRALLDCAFLPWRPAAPMLYHVLWDRVRKIGARARAAGILKRELQFSPHLFRRSYATALYKSGMGFKAIQEKTRHANIEVLMKHYVDDSEPAGPHFDKILQEATA